MKSGDAIKSQIPDEYVEMPQVIHVNRRLETKQSQIEKALKESEEKYWELIDHLSVGVYRTTADGEIFEANQKLADLLGYESIYSLKQVNVNDLYIRNTERKNLLKKINNSNSKFAEFELRRKDGQTIWVRDYSKAVSEPDGSILYYDGILEDITEHKQAVEALRESEEKYRGLVENANDAIYIISSQGFDYINPAFEMLSGYRAKEACNKKFNFWKIIAPEDQQFIKEREESRKRGEKIPSTYEFRVISKDGKTKDVEATTVEIGKKGEIKVIGILRDITERKRMEKALKVSENKYRYIVDNALVGVYKTNLRGDILLVNSALARIFGFKRQEEMMKESVILRYRNPKDRALLLEELKKKGRVNNFEIEVVTKTGETRNILLSGVLEGDVISGMIADITERKLAEKRLKASLKEKEVMLQEIHHRVKNNMQVISSILNLQSMYIKDELAFEILKETRDRVRSMALVHEKLYGSEDFARIDFAAYVENLTVHLLHSYNVDPKTIELKLNVDKVFLDINIAIPCGLIINELVSNSLKHAFPDGKKGKIGIDLFTLSEGKFALTVRDDGSSFPKDLDFSDTKTLGLQLVVMLVEQLGGTIKLSQKNGKEFEILFREPKKKKRYKTDESQG